MERRLRTIHQRRDYIAVSEQPKIAVVDDDRDIRAAVEGLLESLGYSALLFASAEEFLRYPAREQLACMIVDVRMPGLSGIQLQSILRGEADCPPIIFMTSYGDDITRDRALAGGACCFVSKPVDSAVLIECLEKAVSGRCER